MTDEEAQSLKVPIDAVFLANNTATTWTTDAGPLDVMLTMPDWNVVRRPFEHYAPRRSSVGYVGIVVRVAALSDIIASKEFAKRPKDQEALPELRALLAREEAE